ncbi:MAG: ORF6N domain-containing protein [Aquirufa sp.]
MDGIDVFIHQKIIEVRGRKVLFDFELAKLYGVPTKVLTQSLKRNLERFPEDFMFQLSDEEFAILRSQIVTTNKGGRRYLPFVFTEQGVAMLSSVLKSSISIQINIAIMRVFVLLRQNQANLDLLMDKILEMKNDQVNHQNEIENIYKIIDELLIPMTQRETIGFKKIDSN